MRTEEDTRAELIEPQLKEAGWGVVEGSRVLRERHLNQITDGRIQTGGGRGTPLIADFILEYKGKKLAVIEAKKDSLDVAEGVAQAKLYASKLNVLTTYSTNGKKLYQICLETAKEGLVDRYLTPQELWEKSYPVEKETHYSEEWRQKFSVIPFEDKSGTWKPRYYQELAINKALEKVAKGQNRILLTLATGTGKTAIAFQIAWKLFQTRWNLSVGNDYKHRRPRVLFLADRNILANQAFNSFSAFPDDALLRVKPDEIKKNGRVPINGSIFFTIFQTLMSNDNNVEEEENEEHVVYGDVSDAYFNQYDKDFFDLVIIDECHRGGANDEGNWHKMLEYFSPAVQLGLTATPKREENADTYKYFGEPAFIYSLKDGINDGFLTPFKVKRISTTLDDYIYTSDDVVEEGEIEEGRLYKETDFNRTIIIEARERYRVKAFMNDANENDKTIIFCATQEHAAMVRDIVNQCKKSSNIDYCVRVTANDGKIGEDALKQFQDNEKTIPTVLTTSQKLSTGVDARNVRNIVLLRPVNQIIEFKQIVGRGTRTFDGKDYFTIYDFVDAHQRFLDPQWDGEPEEPVEDSKTGRIDEPIIDKEPSFKESKTLKKVKVKLQNGKELSIKHTSQTMFWDADGKPVSAETFLQRLFGELPNLFKSEEELRKLWCNPMTRRELLNKLSHAGYGREELNALRRLIDAEGSDLFDVLEYVFNSDRKPITRSQRVAAAQATIFAILDYKQKEFIEFVLSKYIEVGVDELDQSKLPILLESKYQTQSDGIHSLGGDATKIMTMFRDFQQYLYSAV